MIGGGEEVDYRVLFLVFPSAGSSFLYFLFLFPFLSLLGCAGSRWALRRSRCDGSDRGDQTHPVWLKFVF